MTTFRHQVLPILFATLWISASEFVRNEFLFKFYWTDHYEQMGLTFPDKPLNGLVWVLWSFLFAVLIFFLEKKFSVLQTTLLAWFAGFVLMWVVTFNLDVLPVDILLLGVPLSLLEAFLAAWIVRRSRKAEGGKRN